MSTPYPAHKSRGARTTEPRSRSTYPNKTTTAPTTRRAAFLLSSKPNSRGRCAPSPASPPRFPSIAKGYPLTDFKSIWPRVPRRALRAASRARGDRPHPVGFPLRDLVRRRLRHPQILGTQLFESRPIAA